MKVLALLLGTLASVSSVTAVESVLENRYLDLGGATVETAGWDSTGDWNSYVTQITNGTLRVTDRVVTHSDEIRIWNGGVLEFVPGTVFNTAVWDAAAHRLSVRQGGRFDFGGELGIYRFQLSVDPGGSATLAPSAVKILYNTAQKSSIENRGRLEFGTFLVAGGSTSEAFSLSVRQCAGEMSVGCLGLADENVPGSYAFSWEGGTVSAPHGGGISFGLRTIAAGACVTASVPESARLSLPDFSCGSGSRVVKVGKGELEMLPLPPSLVVAEGTLRLPSGTFDVSGVELCAGARIVVDEGLMMEREGNLLTVREAPAGAVRVTSLCSPADGCEPLDNPGQGNAGGHWTMLVPGGASDGERIAGDCSKLWCLARFSKGYVYNGDPTNYSEHVEGFVGGADIPLDANALLAISNTLLSARNNGGSVVTRIAYTYDQYGGTECDDFEMILTHIRQVASVCSCFTDVVAAVECGVIGAWGEMHTSRYDDAGHSRRIMETWLDNLPRSVPLLVRSPKFIEHFAGVDLSTIVNRPESLSEAMRGQLARIGLYNDGYLGSWSDIGTWSSSRPRELGCAYLAQRPWLPYGGEFATSGLDYIRGDAGGWRLFETNGWNIVREWYQTHLGYLRTIESSGMGVYKELASHVFSSAEFAYDGMPKLDEFDGMDLRTFCRCHMGARFVIRRAEVDVERSVMRLTVENTGFGRARFPLSTAVAFVREPSDGSTGKVVRYVPEVACDTRWEEIDPAETRVVTVSFANPKAMLYPGRWRIDIGLRTSVGAWFSFANADSRDEPFRLNTVARLSVRPVPQGSVFEVW